MSTVHEIENAISELPVEQMEAIRDWLDEMIEEKLEVRPEYKAKIERARAEMENGALRT